MRRTRWLSQVPGWPLASLPRSQTPPPCACPTDPSTHLPSPNLLMPRTGRTIELSEFIHAASTLAAYASRFGFPTRARLASGCAVSLSRTGSGCPCLQGHFKAFQLNVSPSWHPHFPVLPWRDSNSQYGWEAPYGATTNAQNRRKRVCSVPVRACFIDGGRQIENCCGVTGEDCFPGANPVR